MKKTIVLTLLLTLLLLPLGCQEETLKQEPQAAQHPTTIQQMNSLEEWSKTVNQRFAAANQRFAAVDNNLLFLYRLIDPNSAD